MHISAGGGDTNQRTLKLKIILRLRLKLVWELPNGHSSVPEFGWR